MGSATRKAAISEYKQEADELGISLQEYLLLSILERLDDMETLKKDIWRIRTHTKNLSNMDNTLYGIWENSNKLNDIESSVSTIETNTY